MFFLHLEQKKTFPVCIYNSALVINIEAVEAPSKNNDISGQNQYLAIRATCHTVVKIADDFNSIGSFHFIGYKKHEESSEVKTANFYK